MENPGPSDARTLLITTVGGSPEAIVAGILHLRPDRIVFVCSPETAKLVEGPDDRGNPGILERLRRNGFEVPAGAWEIVQIVDAQDLESLVRQARQQIEPAARHWVRDPSRDRVVVDFTGGTKCMSAGLVLASLDWPCEWQYVGGTERTKGGVGVVVDGKEQIVNPRNPWDTLAWRHVLRAAALFDEGETGGAVAVLEGALRRTGPGRLNRALGTLFQFCRIYHEWDAFRHADAHMAARDFLKNVDTLSFFVSPDRVEHFHRRVSADATLLEKLSQGGGPRPLLVADIYSNGLRRMRERRFDDAVARFYRCVEALAQVALAAHGIHSTAAVPVQSIPEELRAEWNLPAGCETVELPLSRSYQLLAALGDELGQRFLESRLASREKSPLQARNHSILAHGFHAVSEADADSLKKELEALAGGWLKDQIPVFPKLSDLLGTF